MNGHTPEQIASAYATLDLALAHPHAFDMRWWAVPAADEAFEITLEDLTDRCGTTACFAGWHAARLGKAVDIRGDIRGDLRDRGGWIPLADFVRIDLGLTERAADRIFLETPTFELPAAIEAEFGSRPDPA